MSDYKKLVIDLDGTICTQKNSHEYHLASPIKKVIDKINDMYNDGWWITIFTARGMNTFSNIHLIEVNYREMTEKWLHENNVSYHELIFGKPSATLYVDDKNLSIEHFVKN